MASNPAQQTTRGERRRAQTRASLIRAAQELISEGGSDNLRVAELTERADVGFGSFYNHFADKEELVAAVADDAVREHRAVVERFESTIDDPAELIAVAQKHFLGLAASDPTVGWVIVRLDASHSLLASTLGPYAAGQIVAGMESGRFVARDVRFTLEVLGSALTGAMRSVLEGRAPANAGELQAELVLRVLGLDRDEAAEIAQRATLPPLVQN